MLFYHERQALERALLALRRLLPIGLFMVLLIVGAQLATHEAERQSLQVDLAILIRQHQFNSDSDIVRDFIETCRRHNLEIDLRNVRVERSPD